MSVALSFPGKFGMLRPNQLSGVAEQAGNEQENDGASEDLDEEEDENDPDVMWEEVKQMRNQIDKLRAVVEYLKKESKQSAGNPGKENYHAQ